MYQDFLSNGSVLAILLMTYSGFVMRESIKREKLDPFNCPKIIKHPLSSVLMFLSIPCAIWPAIYIGMYLGWLVGIISWVVLQILGAFIIVLLAIREPYLGFHFIAASVLFPLGYYLSISTLLV